MNKGLSMSGASTKIPAIAGAAITTCQEYGYKPNYITGVSAGSILSVPIALGLFDEIKEMVLNFTLDDIFDIKPVNNKGNLTFCAIYRAISGKESFGSQKNLLKSIKKVVTEERFETFLKGDVEVFVGTVEFKTGKSDVIRIKDCTYNEYLNTILASTSIPVFVESVKMKNGFYYDGGVRNHIISAWLMKNFDLKNHISIYSRPENYDMTEKDWTPKNIYQVLQRTIDIMETEISKNSEFKEDEYAKEKSINNKKIFMPYILAKDTYEITPELLKKWYELGVEAAKKVF